MWDIRGIYVGYTWDIRGIYMGYIRINNMSNRDNKRREYERR